MPNMQQQGKSSKTDSGTSKPADNGAVTSGATLALDFTDHDAPPSAAEINRAKNPFYDKVGELKANLGKAASFVAPKSQADTLINQFRSACSSHDIGGRVRQEEMGGDRVRIYIWCAPKRGYKSGD